MKKSILSLLLACFLQINLAFAQNVMKGACHDVISQIMFFANFVNS